MLVPSPSPPIHSVAWFEKGQGNSLKCNSANFSARRSRSGGIPAHGVMMFALCLPLRKNSAEAVYPNLGNRTRSRQMHAVLLLFRPLLNVGIQNFGMWGMYDLAKTYRSIEKPIANRQVEDWEASNGHIKDTIRLFRGPWHHPIGEHICAQSFRMWNRLRFCKCHKYFKNAKAMQINRILKISLIWHVMLNQP